MTSRPYYGRFELDFGLKAGLKVFAADTPLETCLQPDVVEIFEETLQKAKREGIQVKALLIVNPHNPLGKYTNGKHPHRILTHALQADATPEKL